MKKLLIVMLTLTLLASFLSAACYVYNSGVEDWTTNGASGPPDYWTLTSTNITATQESTTIHGGTYSTKIIWTDNTNVESFDEDLDSNNYAGNDYEFCAYIYDNNTSGRVRLAISWEDNYPHLLSTDYSDYSVNTAGWQYLRTGKLTAPANTERILISVETADDTNWNGSATVYADDLTFCDNNCPLPVELGSFYATYNNDELALHWKTYSEINNNQWNIYRATNDDFENAEKVNATRIEGNGTTSEVHDYTYIDDTPVETGQTYYYWIESLDNSGSSELYMPVTVEIANNEEPDAPVVTDTEVLSQNYPNPFNPETTIKFNVEQGKEITIAIYNMKGEKVKTLFNKTSQGETSVRWSGDDENGNSVPSGVYFYKLTTDKESYIRKMILLK